MIIKNGYILTLDNHNTILENGDLLIVGNKISDIGKSLTDLYPNEINIFDATGKLVMPGIINCHLHSDSNLFKGYFDNLPLDVWMMNAIPLKYYGPLPDRLIYLRTLLGAVEMLKCGVTCVQDDPSEFPYPTARGFSNIMNAYKDIGLRANVACHFADKAEYDKLPYMKEIIPNDVYDELTELKPENIDHYWKFYDEFYEEWHRTHDDMYRIVISPSTPHRCSDELLKRVVEFSNKKNVQINIHALETKSQAVSGGYFYNGRSLIEHCYDLGMMSPLLTIIHSVWAKENDMKLMADNGVSVAHNPVSNLKLGSGVAPLRKLMDYGVNVGLGTDGISSNDNQNMFDVIKTAGLIHKISNPDYHLWPTANEVLRLATSGSAKASGRGDQVGSLEIGKKADIAILNLHTNAFTPLLNVQNQLVYCEKGESVDTVIVNGKKVVENHKILNVNEDDIYSEINSIMPEFWEGYQKAVSFGNHIIPYVEKVYEKCMSQDIGINRLNYHKNE